MAAAKAGFAEAFNGFDHRYTSPVTLFSVPVSCICARKVIEV
jgi:hypothetical protein